ncbi:unnamed protein product, partial [marine sediment metagenome]
RSKGMFTGRDPRTGQVKNEFKPDVNPFAIMHQRCYPSKATDRYIMPSWIGIEFIDPTTKHWQIHHWVRGSCVYGVMPCNGLVYAPPHSCACYYQSKLNGFCALAPAEKASPRPRPSPRPSEHSRLIKGRAYGKIKNSPSQIDNGAWSTYRHDIGRSGYTKTEVPIDLAPSWTAKLSGKLTSMTVAEGRVFVAAVNKHILYALDDDSGKILWSFTAGGRIDSPPTIYKGQVLFGCADGWVYSLRSADGELAWRFRAAP